MGITTNAHIVDSRESEARPVSTDPLEIVLITGMSGAGRGTAARLLEEFGWYVVDNLPLELIVRTAEITQNSKRDIRHLAIVTDVRSQNFSGSLDFVVHELRARGWSPRVLFLDATDEVLIRRYNQLRKTRPLQDKRPLEEGIRDERELLADLKNHADLVVDTSRLTSTKLRERLSEFRASGDKGLDIIVESFGFKYGVPLDADFVVDMRFLPNPYWVPTLRPHSGLDSGVSEYVLNNKVAAEFIDNFARMIVLATPGYRAEGKAYVLLGVGCTGGKHRSVATTMELTRRLAEALPDANVTAVHRDLGRE